MFSLPALDLRLGSAVGRGSHPEELRFRRF